MAVVDFGPLSRAFSIEDLCRQGISCEPSCGQELFPLPETHQPGAFGENIRPSEANGWLEESNKTDGHWAPSPGDFEKLDLIDDPEAMMRVLERAEPFLRRAKDRKDFSIYPVIERALDSCLKLISADRASKGSSEVFLSGKDVKAVRGTFRKQFLGVIVSSWTSYRKFKKNVDYLLRKGSKF